MFAFESFRAARWLRTFNLVLQAVLFLTLFGGLNYLARNHAWRFDLTKQRKFSLSAETLSYIKNFDRPVHVVVTLSEENDNPTVRGLLDEYAYVTEKSAGPITREYLDVYRDRRRAEELGVDQSDVIVLIAGEKKRAIPINDLYRIRNKERVAFNGEQALTAALLEVSRPTREKIYFLTSHGEMEPADTDNLRGLSRLRDELRSRNFEIHTLELAVARGIPNDASLLVAVAPRSRYSASEQELLRQYLTARAGRLILFLAPGSSAAKLGLDDLLLDWGVFVDDDVIFDPGAENRTDDGDLVVRFFDETHPATQTLVSYKLPLRFGLARSVQPDPGRPLGSGFTTLVLAAASRTAWGEVDYNNLRTAPRYDPGVDIRPLPGMKPEGQLGVIVASERVSVRDNLPFSVPGGRLVVFGTGDLVSNHRIGHQGNFPMFLGAVNWTVDRDRQLNIAARPIERFSLSLSAAEFLRLRYALLLALPGGVLLLGLIVYWTRRV
jgi:hypothetical protein